MMHFRKILVPGIGKLEKLLDTIVKCESPEQLYSKIQGEIIKPYRPNKPKTIIRFKLDNKYYYLKIRWRLNIDRTIKDLLQGNMIGCKEAKKYLILQQHRFKIPKLVAYGCTRYIFTMNHSYQITEEVKGIRSIKELFNEKHRDKLIKDMSRLIWQLHKNKFIYGSKQLHYDNILVTKDDSKTELYLIDPIGLKKSKNFDKRLDDLMSFIYKNNKTWLSNNSIELFLRNYYQYYSKSEKKSLSFKDFKNQINRKLQKNNMNEI